MHFPIVRSPVLCLSGLSAKKYGKRIGIRMTAFGLGLPSHMAQVLVWPPLEPSYC